MSFVLADFLARIEPLPQFIVDLHEAAKAKTGAYVVDNGIELDTAVNIGLATDDLKDVLKFRDPPTAGQGGNNYTYELFCRLRDRGVSMGTAVELFDQHMNPHCRPPWQHGELETFAHNAWEYAKSSEGAWAVDDPVVTFSTVIAANRFNRPNFIPFTELQGRTVGPVREVVGDLIERDIPNFMCGHGGTNKSRLSLQLGICIQGGVKIMDKPVEKATLVYVSSEDGQDEMARRIQAISKKLDIAVVNAVLVDRKGKTSALAKLEEGGKYDTLPFFDALIDDLKSVEGHKILVLDSCLDFVQFLGRSKMDEGAVNAFVKQVLQTICTVTDSTMIVIWHTSKAGRDDGSGWSVAWENAPRNRLLMRTVEEDTYELSQPKRNHGKPIKPILLKYKEGTLMHVTAAEQAAEQSELADLLIKAALQCAHQGAPMTRLQTPDWVLEDIVAATGKQRPSQHVIRNVLEKAIRDKVLTYSNTAKTTGFIKHPLYDANLAADNDSRRQQGDSKADNDTAKPPG